MLCCVCISSTEPCIFYICLFIFYFILINFVLLLYMYIYFNYLFYFIYLLFIYYYLLLCQYKAEERNKTRNRTINRKRTIFFSFFTIFLGWGRYVVHVYCLPQIYTCHQLRRSVYFPAISIFVKIKNWNLENWP